MKHDKHYGAAFWLCLWSPAAVALASLVLWGGAS